MGNPTPTPPLEDYAIVISVNYPDGNLNILQGARRDAAAFCRWLKSPRGGKVPAKNIKRVESRLNQTSLDDAVPTRDEIDRELLKIGIGSLSRPFGRRLYFYFAGHGVGEDPDEVCLLTARATSLQYNNNISLLHYSRVLNRAFYFEEVVFILDCCRSPIPEVEGFTPQTPSFALAEDAQRPVVSELRMFAALNGAPAHETEDPNSQQREKRGIFTLALLNALRSKVGVDQHSQYTAENIQDNLDAHMKALATRNGGAALSQLASIIHRDDRRTGLVLAKIPNITNVRVRIVADPWITGELIVFDNAELEIARRAAAEVTADKTAWRVPMRPTKSYTVLNVATNGDERVAAIAWAEVAANSKDGNYEFLFS